MTHDFGKPLSGADRVEELHNAVVHLQSDSISVAKAVDYAFRRFSYTVDREDMDSRTSVERFDSIVQGEIATNSVIQHIRKDIGLYCCSYDELRADASKSEDNGWDALVLQCPSWYEERRVRNTVARPFKISVKSSVIPKGDNDDLRAVINQWDIKILKYKNHVYQDLVNIDAVIQAYYPLLSASRNGINFDAADRIIAKPVLSVRDLSDLSEHLKLEQRYGKVHIVALAGTSEIIRHVQKLGDRDKVDFMSMPGGKKKAIWNVKMRDVGMPFSKFASVVRSHLDELDFGSAQPV